MNGHLFLFDFDGSIAQTFKPGPFGISVKEAYERSIYDIFGGDGLVTYEQLGGLKNRAASELVHDLFSRNVGLTEMTRGFYESDNRCVKVSIEELVILIGHLTTSCSLKYSSLKNPKTGQLQRLRFNLGSGASRANSRRTARSTKIIISYRTD